MRTAKANPGAARIRRRSGENPTAPIIAAIITAIIAAIITAIIAAIIAAIITAIIAAIIAAIITAIITAIVGHACSVTGLARPLPPPVQ